MLSYKEIKEACEDLKTIPLSSKKKDKETGKWVEVITHYPPVNEKLKVFLNLFKDCHIETSIVQDKEIKKGEDIFYKCIIKATVYDCNDKILATGLATETSSSTGVNSKSYLENCETSAVGRALSFLGIGIEQAIASAEDMSRVESKKETSSNSDTVLTNLFSKAISVYGSNKDVYKVLGTTQKKFKEEMVDPKNHDRLIEQLKLILGDKNVK
ncbi:hypothetical protein [Anaerofustis sp.]|uniref:hypothetical protein n=1 Tax=Anaerofustis sp. TaxID=1872517 RepID=UPI0025BAA3E7|nr:hypothetical protein [Anaerofustis sp.]